MSPLDGPVWQRCDAGVLVIDRDGVLVDVRNRSRELGPVPHAQGGDHIDHPSSEPAIVLWCEERPFHARRSYFDGEERYGRGQLFDPPLDMPRNGFTQIGIHVAFAIDRKTQVEDAM